MSTLVSPRLSQLCTGRTRVFTSDIASCSRSVSHSARARAPSPSPSTSAASTSTTKPSAPPHADGPAARPLRMIMFGKPGAGKGTLSAKLVASYDVEPISTGDLLRAEVRAQTELGKEVETIMARGGIVEDHLVLRLVSKKLGQLRDHGVHNWILDGFPRTLSQGRQLDPLLRRLGAPLNLVVNLDVPDEVILSRIADRWIHLPSGRVYNLGYNKPKVPGRDDITGEPLSKRPDDRPEVAAKRLATFYEMTSPLLDYYSAQAVSPMSSMTSRLPSATSSAMQPHASGAEPLLLTSIAGRTSDEIWPKLENLVVDYFGVRERGAASGGGGMKKRSVESGIDVSAVEAFEKQQRAQKGARLAQTA